MSFEDARAFVRGLVEDKSRVERLRNRLTEDVGNFDEWDEENLRERMAEVVPEFAEEHGYDFTAEEGFEALEKLRAEMESGELTDAELERVSGGDAKSEGEVRAISFTTIGIGCAVYSSEESGSDDLSCKFK